MARVELTRQRPGVNIPTGMLTDPRLSRRQLELRPDDDRLHAKNVGRRQLLKNGVAVDEAHFEAGDTLHIEGVLLFVVELRPRVLPKHDPEPDADFAFGAPDADGLVGESPLAWQTRQMLMQVARMRAHVLVLGATGTGKELAARVIHRCSGRAGAFVARNAATVPEGLIDAELFGTAKNYPNSGCPERSGLVALADTGTLFLDEVGELPESHQAHLLRVLDNGGEYQRLGEGKVRRADLRLVAATNRAPEELKHDFLARFGVRVVVPSLAERQSDVPLLLAELCRVIAAEDCAFGERFRDDTGRVRLSPYLVESLLRYHHPENVRGLDRVLRAAFLSSPADVLELTPAVAQALPGEEFAAAPDAGNEQPRSQLDKSEIEQALARAGGSVTAAAKQLGISRYTLYRWMRKADIE